MPLGHSFVVFEGDAKGRVRGSLSHLFEAVEAHGGVIAQAATIVVSKFAFFVEEFFGDEDFTYVMDHSGEAHEVEFVHVADAQGVGEGDHPGADVDHVGGGVSLSRVARR